MCKANVILKKINICEINYNPYSLKAVIKASFGKSISNLASVANGFWLTILLVTIVLEKR